MERELDILQAAYEGKHVPHEKLLTSAQVVAKEIAKLVPPSLWGQPILRGIAVENGHLVRRTPKTKIVDNFSCPTIAGAYSLASLVSRSSLIERLIDSITLLAPPHSA